MDTTTATRREATVFLAAVIAFLHSRAATAEEPQGEPPVPCEISAFIDTTGYDADGQEEGGGHRMYGLIVAPDGTWKLNRRVFHGDERVMIPLAEGGPSDPLPELARALVEMHRAV